MVKDLFKDIAENENFLTNIAHFTYLQEEKKKQCSHLPIFLGVSKTTMIVRDNIEQPQPYKRCLLCGKDLSFEVGFDYEFDASQFLDSEIDTLEDLNYNYLQMLQLFKEVCKNTDTKEEAFQLFKEVCKNADTKEEAFQLFNKTINDIKFQKILKKTIANKK